jgi:hypothetical protein
MVDYDKIKRFAIMLLSDDSGRAVTKERLLEAVETAILASPGFEERERLIREIEGTLSVAIADGTMLVGDRPHVPWLDQSRARINWEFWRRYRNWLTDMRGWPATVVDKIDVLTDRVLEQLESPETDGPWDRRGLVVGQVQSGKTSHYTGLICKAVDAGYRLIIVLAGGHNSLRSQTQTRLDEGFLGRDSFKERAWALNKKVIGAGLLGNTSIQVAYLTNSEDKGDFSNAIAQQVGVPPGSAPILLVVKKNANKDKGILPNLVSWLESHCPTETQDGRKLYRDVPLLLLDDEADYASLNTKEIVYGEDGQPLSEQETTAINMRIRQLLRMFSKSAYVAYTATPFANIFVNPDVDVNDIGRDLFPRDFILNLPAPSNYIGPVKVFGLGEETDGELEQKGLPTLRIIDDFEDDLPQNHKNGHPVAKLPPSLREALLAFMLTCAARAARGQGREHNSMLVHVTMFTNVQDRVAELLEEELTAIRNRIMFGDGRRPDTVLLELEQLWTRDFAPTSNRVAELLYDPEASPLTWADVAGQLRDAVAKIKIKKINGQAKDVLDYYGNSDGISVIAVGGNKLSRGLTLEGLSVSYYLRASRMYDTLMQMGRWFGYRPGYADLCRLYTTSELVSWYRHITIASEELRRDFDEMARTDRTPAEFGLKVRTHPGSLIITGAGKLRNQTTLRVSFSDRLIESYRISNVRKDQLGNFLTLGRFIGTLGAPDKNSPHYLWETVGNEKVTGFLEDLQGYPLAFDFAPKRLAEFIRNLVTDGELTEWRVGLINVSANYAAGRGTDLGGLKIGYSERNPGEGESGLIHRHLISMPHEWLDIDDPGVARARAAWRMEKGNAEKEEPDTLPGRLARRERGVEHGLLLLYLIDPTVEGLPKGQQDTPYVGYALSFPPSPNGDKRAVSYTVNSIYVKEELQSE